MMGHCVSKNGEQAVNEGNGNASNIPKPPLMRKNGDSFSKEDDQTNSETASSSTDWSVPRAKRQPWSDYVTTAYWDSLSSKIDPHSTTSTPRSDVLDTLKGDMSKISQPEPKMFSVFVSSTFTDTEEERNLLIEDVQPYLREICSLFGYEFRFCEMRWGVRDEASEDHQTVNLCMQELRRCQEESRGLNFITLLCDKYGYCPFPCEIPSEEFELLLSLVTEQSSKEVLQKWFKIDTNKAQPSYVLQKISSILSDYNSEERVRRKEARDIWWKEFEMMQQALKKASEVLKSDERKQLYQISVTELEVFNGLLNVGDSNEKTFMINRAFTDVEEHITDKEAGKFIDIDWETKTVNKHSRRQLMLLKNEKVAGKLNDRNIVNYALKWSKGGVTKQSNFAYLRDVSDVICHRVFESIKGEILRDKSKAVNMAVGGAEPIKKALLDEVSVGGATLEKLSKNVIGRDDLSSRIQKYCISKEIPENAEFNHTLDEPLLVCGESGSGKSSVMALAIRNVLEIRDKSMVIFKFIGTASQSGHTRSLLASLIRQIRAVRGKDLESLDIPDNVNLLASQFKQEIAEFESDLHDCMLIIFLDALDQLADVNLISEAEWLPKKLPQSVRIVVSCTPSNETGAVYFQYLRGFLSEENFLHVDKMAEKSCDLLLLSWLDRDERKLASDQEKLIKEVFRANPLPLFMKIAYEETRSWRSYTDVSNHPIKSAKSVEELISQLFDRLTVVHGKRLFNRGIAYITAAKDGLSRQELEDVMSCDDDILDDVFQWWVPPIRRLPSLQVVRFLSDLDEYLTATAGFSDGIPLLHWFHRQCKQLVIKTMRQSQNVQEIHQTLARYFSGHWAENGKPFINKKKDNKEEVADRKLPRNQLIVQGNLIKSQNAAKRTLSFIELGEDDCKINNRRVSELCFHFIKAGLRKEVEETLCSLEYIQAKAICGQMEDLRQEYALALGSSASVQNWPGRAKVAEFSSFVLQRGHVINQYPSLVYQEAANYKEDSAVRSSYSECKDKPRFLLSTSLCTDDALYSVIEGHNEAVLCVAFQRNGNRSSAEVLPDSVSSPGTEAVAELSTQQASGSISNNLLASGSLDGRIKIWSYVSGLEISSFQGHSKAVNDCDFLDNYLLSISADAKMCLWDATDLTLLKTWEVKDEKGSEIAGNSCKIFSEDKTVLLFSSWDDGAVRVGDISGNWLFQTEFKEYAATCFSLSVSKELTVGFADGKILGCDISNMLQGQSTAVEFTEDLTDKCSLKEVFSITQYEDIIVVAGKERAIRTQFSEDSNSGWARNMFKNDKLVKQWVEEGMDNTEAIQKKMDLEMSSKGTFVIRKKPNDSFTVHVLEGLPTPHEYECVCLFFPYLATGGSDGSVRLWLVNRAESDDGVDAYLLLELGKHTSEVNKLHFSPDGSYLVSCSDEAEIQIWDVRKAIAERKAKFMKTKYKITGCAANENGDFAVTWGQRGMVSMWNVAESSCLWSKICCSSEDINSASITPDGGKVMMAGDNYYELLNGKTGSTYDVKRSCVGRTVCICSFSADGTTALLGDNCDIRLVVVEPEMKPLGFGDTVWKAHDRRVSCAQFGREGYFVVSGSDDGTVKFWNDNHECIYMIEIGSKLVSLVYRESLCMLSCVVQGEMSQEVKFSSPSLESKTQESSQEQVGPGSDRNDVESQDDNCILDKIESVGNKDATEGTRAPSERQHPSGNENVADITIESQEDNLGHKVQFGNEMWFLPEAPVAFESTAITGNEQNSAFPVNGAPSDLFSYSNQLQGPFPIQDSPFMPPPMSEEMLQNLQNLQAMLMSPPDPSEFMPPDIPATKPGPHRLQKKQKRHVQYQSKTKAGISTLGIFHVDLSARTGSIISRKTKNGLQNCVLSFDGNTVCCSSASGEVYVWRMLQDEWYDIARFVNESEAFVASLGSDCNKFLVSSGEQIVPTTVIENEI